jgi:uncharacterized membrane protein YccC
MSGVPVARDARPSLHIPQPFVWLENLWQLLARELAPSERKIRMAVRLATVATFGATLVVCCHVNNEVGTLLVWLMAGAGPMLSARKGLLSLTAEALLLIFAVVTARMFVDTPWLMLPLLFGLYSIATYIQTTWKIGPLLTRIQVVTLDAYYGAVFASRDIGWQAGGAFGGSVIAVGTMLLFDHWLWPDPSEPLLRAEMGASVARTRSRFLRAAAFYFDPDRAPKPPAPAPTTDLPQHMELLARAEAEGISEHTHAVLLAAVTRVARLSIEVDRLTSLARETVPQEMRSMLRPQLEAAVTAIAEALDEIAHEIPTTIRVGVDLPPPPSQIRARTAIDALTVRVSEARPHFFGRASSAEIANFASFTDSLAAVTAKLERPFDEPPPRLAKAVAHTAAAPVGKGLDPTTARFSMKVGLCIVVGYVTGLTAGRLDLITIMTTILLTALPSYGATARKMILRVVGAAIGGVVTLLAIILVSPNSKDLPAYIIVVFIVFFVSSYGSLSSGRVAYAGKQIGTTFALLFTGLSPAIDVYAPLWRMWGIFLGIFIVTGVLLLLWPVYAGDSLLPRLCRVIANTIELIPSERDTRTEDEIQSTNAATMRVLAEILEIANDAEMEGRGSVVNAQAIIEAAGNLRRIANRLSSISVVRIAAAMPPLDAETEAVRQAVMDSVKHQLQGWLEFFTNGNSLSSAGGTTTLIGKADESEEPLKEFGSRIEENAYAPVASWTSEQRRGLLAELHSMRRIVFLMGELNQWLPEIPNTLGHQVRRFDR